MCAVYAYACTVKPPSNDLSLSHSLSFDKARIELERKMFQNMLHRTQTKRTAKIGKATIARMNLKKEKKDEARREQRGFSLCAFDACA